MNRFTTLLAVFAVLAIASGLASSASALALGSCRLDGYLGIDSIDVSPLSRTHVRVTVVDTTGGVYQLPYEAGAVLLDTIELDGFNVFNDVVQPSLVRSGEDRWYFRSFESRVEVLHPIDCE